VKEACTGRVFFEPQIIPTCTNGAVAVRLGLAAWARVVSPLQTNLIGKIFLAHFRVSAFGQEEV